MSPVRLFRFSALTFNGHRIHYDLDYAARVEKYPALVVHGPLQAMLMMQAARRHTPGRAVEAFTHRGVRPLLLMDTARIVAEAETEGTTALCTATADGVQCMQTRVIWAEGA